MPPSHSNRRLGNWLVALYFLVIGGGVVVGLLLWLGGSLRAFFAGL